MGLVWTADDDKRRIVLEYSGVLTSHELNNTSAALQDPHIEGYALLFDFTRVDAKQVTYIDLASEIQTLVVHLLDRKITRLAHVSSNAEQDQLSGFFKTIKELVSGSEVIELEQFSDLSTAEDWLSEKP
jgi:hypothetical protein